MKISIHQSLCGEKGGAWDLLKTTLKDIKVAQAIAFKTDLHDTASGKAWGPATRGFCYGEFFLIIKSFVDPSNQVRQGRAFSHVLILEKKDLPHIDNLGTLLDLLPAEIDKDIPIHPLLIDSAQFKLKSTDQELNEPFLGRFKKMISGYVSYHNYVNTLVWVGEKDYNEAVSELWQRLTLAEKEVFNFDIYFNASAVPKQTINLITIPEKNLNKFQNTGFLIIGPNDSADLSSLSEQILIGDKQSHDRIRKFADGIGSDPFPRGEWDTVGIVLNTFENYQAEGDFKKLNSLGHIIASYSPSPKKGVAFKQKFVKHLADLITRSAYQQFAILKTFKIESFSGSKAVLSGAVHKWLTKQIFDTGTPNIESLRIFDLLNIPMSKDWLTKSIDDNVTEYLKNADESQITLFFSWLELDITIFRTLARYLKLVSEEMIVQALSDTLSINITAQLLKFAEENNYLVLYAHLVLQSSGIEAAFTKILSLDKTSGLAKGMAVVLAAASPNEIIRSAFSTRNPQLVAAAGQTCRKSPSLLNDIDIRDPLGQEIWVESIRLGNAVDDGFKKFASILDMLFDSMIRGTSVNANLLKTISGTKYANILNYKSRNELWPRLNNDIRTSFLRETSAHLLRELSSGKNITVPNDPTLSTYVSDYAINDFVYYNRNNIRPVIPIFKRFTSISNRYFEDYLRRFNGPLDGGDAKQLGKLINSRKSTEAAHIVYQRTAKNNSWSIAIKECHDLLPLFDRGKLYVSELIPKFKINKDQWWQNIEQLLVNYYSNPISLTRIWERAGGHESDLVLGVPTRETWAKALKKLRGQSFKKITMNSLLKEVDGQFGHIEDFKFLYKIRKSYIK